MAGVASFKHLAGLFIVVFTAAPLAGCSASVACNAGCDDQGCPLTAPSSGDACDEEGLSCPYADSCGSAVAVCKDGAFDVSVDIANCTPACPDTLPADGDACDPLVDSTCSYSSGLDYCDGDVVATCTADGWTHTAPACACPADVPVDGTPCLAGASCSYPIDDCGGTAMADCVDGTFSVGFDSMTCPGDCYAMDEIECTGIASDVCRWITPGCSDVPEAIKTEGCFPIEPCEPGAPDACPGETLCLQVDYDPCYQLDCGSCSDATTVCLPPPPP